MTLEEMISWFKNQNGIFRFPTDLEFARHTSGERCFKCKYNFDVEAWVPETFIKVYLLKFYPDNDHTFENMLSGHKFDYHVGSEIPGMLSNIPNFQIPETPHRSAMSDSEYMRMVSHYMRIERQALEKDAEEDAYEHILVKIPKAGSIPDIDYYAFQCFVADFKGIAF